LLKEDGVTQTATKGKEDEGIALKTTKVEKEY
jgi:hypothetical protein